MAGDRRERLDLIEEIETEEGRIEIDVTEVEGAADERMRDGADLFGEARGGRGVLEAIEHPQRFDPEPDAMAGADVAHLTQRVPLLGVQAFDLGLGRGGDPAAVLDQHRGPIAPHTSSRAPTAAL